MKTLFALLSLIFSCAANAQVAIEWQKAVGGNTHDGIREVRQTIDGGYILGGSSRSVVSGEKSEPNFGNNGAYDYWIVKLNISGNIQWENTIGGDSTDQLTSIQETKDGGYIIGGYSISSVSFDKTENSPDYDFWIIKLDSTGNIQWQNTIGGNDRDGIIGDPRVIVQQTFDNGYIVGGGSRSNISGDKTENSNGSWDYWILKLDTLGNIQWQNTIGGSGAEIFDNIEQTADSGYIILGSSASNISGDKTENNTTGQPNDSDYWILKLNAAGNIQWQNTIGGSGNDEASSVTQTKDGGYVLIGTSNSPLSGDKTEDTIGSFDYWVVKLTAIGNIEWDNTIGGTDTDKPYTVMQTSDGGYLVGGYSLSNSSGDKTENTTAGTGYVDGWIVKLDSSGNVLWDNTIGGNGVDIIQSIHPTFDGNYVIGASSQSGISGDKTESNRGGEDFWIFKLKNVNNLITGNIFNDRNLNCLPDTNENWHNYFTVKTTPFQSATPDLQGNYQLWVDTGNYKVELITQHPFLNLQCPSSGSYNVSFPNLADTSADNNFGLKTIINCPWMQIFMCPLRLRSCTDTWLHIRYLNNGTSSAPNSFVQVTLDPLLTVVSSSIPWRTPQTGNTYVFDIGDVGVGEYGSITIRVTVSCSAVIGQTICMKAHVFPDSICVPPLPAWDNSSVEVEGECLNNDTVRFSIRNDGNGDMDDSLSFYIIENNIMLQAKKFKLPKGSSINEYVAANGSTFVLEAEQSIGHPINRNPTVVVEGCGTNGTGGVSLGFGTAFRQQTASPFIYTYCGMITNSYDPNDKTSYPRGVGEDKIISSNTELDYTIRFQNTGNDTAYKVVLRDTLSQYLDIATVESGVSSHPYSFRIYGAGILEWTFDNILLPDSNVNEPESNGFVQFRVNQMPNNPEGTRIKNSANIYFDLNTPVKTNVEFNTVGDIHSILTPVIETPDYKNSIHIYPNPFDNFLTIEISDKAYLTGFEIYDLQGRLLRKYHVPSVSKFSLTGINIDSGMYLYKVITNKRTVNGGKLIRY